MELYKFYFNLNIVVLIIVKFAVPFIRVWVVNILIGCKIIYVLWNVQLDITWQYELGPVHFYVRVIFIRFCRIFYVIHVYHLVELVRENLLNSVSVAKSDGFYKMKLNAYRNVLLDFILCKLQRRMVFVMNVYIPASNVV